MLNIYLDVIYAKNIFQKNHKTNSKYLINSGVCFLKQLQTNILISYIMDLKLGDPSRCEAVGHFTPAGVVVSYFHLLFLIFENHAVIIGYFR